MTSNFCFFESSVINSVIFLSKKDAPWLPPIIRIFFISFFILIEFFSKLYNSFFKIGLITTFLKLNFIGKFFIFSS